MTEKPFFFLFFPTSSWIGDAVKHCLVLGLKIDDLPLNP